MDGFERIRGLYSDSHRRHGDTVGAVLTPKGRQEQRFKPIIEELKKGEVKSLLDYGCGIGLLLDHLNLHKLSTAYTGWDMTPSFIESCRARFGGSGQFAVVDPESELTGNFDMVICSGVFNLATSQSGENSLNYVHRKLLNLMKLTNRVLICDFLSPYVDFQQEYAQHIRSEVITDWLVAAGYRRFVIRHDLLPYEFTVIIYKQSGIKRPENIFEVDAR